MNVVVSFDQRICSTALKL